MAVRIGNEILVNSATQGAQTNQQIATLTGGNFVVVWNDDSQGVGGTGGDTSGGAAKAQVFAADGTKLGLEILVNSATSDHQSRPHIAALENGGFVVVWTDGSQGVGGTGGDTSGLALKAQIFTADGTKVGTEILVNSAVQGDQWYFMSSPVKALDGGGFVIAWTDNSMGFGGTSGDSSNTAVKAQVFTADGARIGNELLVNSATQNAQGDPIQIAATEGGGFVITWTDNSLGVGGATGDGSSSAVKAQIFAVGTLSQEGFRYPIGETGIATSEPNGPNDPLDDGWFTAQDLGTQYDGPNGPTHHLGEDWNKEGGDAGENVYAIFDGEVVYAGFHPEPGATNGFGNTVVIKHTLSDSSVYYSLYAHLGEIFVAVGSINKSTVIGTIGQTGATNADHLHFEIFSIASDADFSDYLESGTPVYNRWGYSPDPSAYAAPPDTGITSLVSYVEGDFTWYNPSIFIDSHQGIETNTASDDFNGDGTSDILWQHASGFVGLYAMDNSAVGTWSGLGTSAAGWSIAGTGDFNGDGSSDIFWLHTSGSHGFYQMSGGAIQAWVDVGVGATGWSVVGTGDYNGDGTSDVLWQNDGSLFVGLYEMNGGVATWANIGTAPGWSILGIGDFTGDGTDDILWQQDSSGFVGFYEMSHSAVAGWGSIGVGAAGWSMVGVGDFNGDGTDDILWQSDAGDVGFYQMDGGAVAAWVGVNSGTSGWSVAAIGDYNGDGTDDILWQEDAMGFVGMYEMHDGIATWINIGTSAPGWEIV